MPRPFIPSSIDQCTPEWLTQALGESGILGAGRIEEVEAEMLGEGEGFMGAIARLHLRLDREVAHAPQTLIVKVPTSSTRLKAQGELLGLYEREIFFYREFASKLPKAPPRCFYSAMDPNPQSPETQRKNIDAIDRLPTWLIRLLIPLGNFLARFSRRRYVMLLEDMAPARVGDQLAGGTREEIEAMVRYLGKMHAHFWNSSALMSTHWIYGLDTAPRSILMMYRRALPGFQKLFGDHIGEKVQKLQLWLIDHVLDLVHEFQRGPFTLVHGDFRLDNVFFENSVHGEIDSEDVVLFDWQIPARGPGAYDLAYFLSSTLGAECSPEDEISLLRLYYRTLLDGGVADYEYETLQRDYQRALLLMVERTTTGLADIETTNERGRKLFEAWVDRLSARVEGLDTDSLLPPLVRPGD